MINNLKKIIVFSIFVIMPLLILDFFIISMLKSQMVFNIVQAHENDDFNKNFVFFLLNSKQIYLFILIVLNIISPFFIFVFLNKKIFLSNDDRIQVLIKENVFLKDEIVKIREETEEYKAVSFLDDLTGLANKRAFLAQLAADINYSVRYNTKVALFFMDLNKFKIVNDDYGHDMGDFVLQEVASRLKKRLRKTDYVARVGGDEFAVILNHTNMVPQIVAEKIEKEIGKPYYADSKTIDFISISIGIAFCPKDADNYEDLIRKADVAMYQAKKDKIGYMIYNDELKKS